MINADEDAGQQLPHRLEAAWSIALAFVIALLTFLPVPSLASLVSLVTGATAIMYGFAPVSLAALHMRDPDRPRKYKAPFPKVRGRGDHLVAVRNTGTASFHMTTAVLPSDSSLARLV